MQRPMTVTNASPMAVPISAATDQKLWATPLAAICTVPNRAVILLSATFTSWNSPFSMPLGTAIPRIRRIMLPFQHKIWFHRRNTVFFFRKQRARITSAAKDLAISDGYATPATPACSTNTPTAFPAILMILDAADRYMVTLVFPMLR